MLGNPDQTRKLANIMNELHLQKQNLRKLVNELLAELPPNHTDDFVTELARQSAVLNHNVNAIVRAQATMRKAIRKKKFAK